MRRPKPGFALVVTLSLMILLTVIAVGLLTISAVTLRSSSQSMAQTEAQANARLALMLAIGDLQKYAGPDRAITANSEILATPSAAIAKPNTTGVWESWWDFNPNSSPTPNYTTEKTNRFRRWLVSSADIAAAESRNFVTTAWTGKSIELVGNESIGVGATNADKVTAGLVPVSKNGKVQGSYGWHVSDESVKARINLYRDPNQNTTLAQKRAMLAGHRPVASVMKRPDGSFLSVLPTDMNAADFTIAKATAGKIIDLNQSELLNQAKGKIKPFRNDVTLYSLGVMADVRGGGLKQDLSSMFEMGSAISNALPAAFTNKKLYESTHGITGVSDPNWSALAGYYNSFLSLTRPDSTPIYATKSSTTNTDLVPIGYNPLPVVAKVEVIYSLIARPCTDVYWFSHDTGNNGALDLYDYFLCLIQTPVVTLHNPYNVHITFNSMKVSFKNIPIAYRFMYQKNGSGPYLSQSVDPASFESYNQMMWHTIQPEKHEFGMTIANWENSFPFSSGNTSKDNIISPMILRPGQTIICGPYLDPTASLKKDAGLGSNTQSFDWLNILSKNMKARPSFVPSLGVETWGVTMAHTVVGHPNWGGSWCSNQMLRDQSPGPNPKISKTTTTDRFYLEYKIQQPKYWTNWNHNSLAAILPATPVQPNFEVTAEIQATAGGPFESCAKITYDYKDDSTLQSIYNNRTYRYPPTDGFKATDLAAPGGVLYSEQSTYAHPFAVFSAYARTTNSGVYETGKRTKSAIDSPQVNLLKDGQLAGTPFLFHNTTRTNFTIDLATQKPAQQAYELNFQPFLSKGDYQDFMDVDALNRVPSLSGNKTTSGIKTGSYIEVPSGPLISIADFRRSNALTTAYLPNFVQPVANSRQHPLMSPDKVIETNPGIAATALLDHSFLANHALYDRFYFSTFARRGTTRADTVFEQFMNGTAPLALQAFEPYLPNGKTIAAAKAELYSSVVPTQTAYKNAAEYQMIRGPFNVNSTNVQAWKAVLASMKQSEVWTLWARSSALEKRISTGTPIPAMSLPNGANTRSAPVTDPNNFDDVRTNDWNGYRELTDNELEILAQKIVDEVRDRGPFLSLSEFVNRQIGPRGTRTLKGALEAAIEKAEINEKQNATSADSFLNQVPITASDVSDPKLYNYKTPEATTGNPAAGAPGWVNQGDLLRILEPAATVRGDTFVIRTYGEAQDAAGNITARAYAEAVVQRVPEYVDPVNRPSLNPYTDPAASAANKAFGRRINVVSFRWLSSNEI